MANFIIRVPTDPSAYPNGSSTNEVETRASDYRDRLRAAFGLRDDVQVELGERAWEVTVEVDPGEPVDPEALEGARMALEDAVRRILSDWWEGEGQGSCA